MYDAFQDLGPHERYAIDTTGETEDETAARVAELLTTSDYRLAPTNDGAVWNAGEDPRRR